MRTTSLLCAALAAGACAPAAPPIADAHDDAPRDAAILDAAALADADAAQTTDDAIIADGDAPTDAAAIPADPWAIGPRLGARRHPDGDLEVRVRSTRATRVELCLFAAPLGEVERLRVPMTREGDLFVLRVRGATLAAAQLGEPLFYGLRAFGPNWPYDPAWAPGSPAGFAADVDGEGNRMNPNKLLIDPYALELSHDPINARSRDHRVFETGPEHRTRDSAPFAPKGVVLPAPTRAAPGPSRAFKDDVIYEVHLRGLTMGDLALPADERGTYAGAARRARYLRELGVTAVELLPLHETPNEQNELTPESGGDNYWGYASLSYFAPERRYAADRAPGGPTRELRAMVDALHAEGLKVYVDVVYNHTAEGGGRGDHVTLYGWRGLDNATYYQLADDARGFADNNGVGANVNVASALAADLVVDSLRYWHEVIGADGFRFDLASVLGNGCARGCFDYRRDRLLERIARELGARPAEGGAGVDLIAEPWGLGARTYQVGNFPAGWAEWNDHHREAIRRDLNRLGVDAVTPRELARRLSGSPDLFADDGRPPAASVNYVTSHDGSTLHDLFSASARANDRPWPCGPSGGGSDEPLWDQRGEPALQRRAARTALALTALAAGVPMMLGGDEMLRTQQGNNNAYNIDSSCTWLDWTRQEEHRAFVDFTRALLAYRARHGALRPAGFWRGDDRDGDGQPQLAWYRDDGARADDGYLDDPTRHYLGWMLDGDELGDAARALFFAYDGWSEDLTVTLPAPPAGTAWHLIADTGAGAEVWSNFHAGDRAPAAAGRTTRVEARALQVWEAR